MAKEKKVAKVFSFARVVKNPDGANVKFEGNQYGLPNTVGAPVALAALRFEDATTITECRFESDTARDAMLVRAWNLARQQNLKALAMGEASCQLVEDGKVTEAADAMRARWGSFVFTLGAASSGQSKVKVSRTELQDLTAKAAKATDMEAEIAALKAQLAKAGKK